MYLSLLPPGSSNFYMRVLDSFPSNPSKGCFTKQRVGLNTLKNMLPDLSRESGIGTHYTNHSLRATAVTRMFNSGLPEKGIAGTSGHRSTKALRCYEHTSEAQLQAVTTSINVVTTKHEEKNECSPALVPQNFSGNFNNYLNEVTWIRNMLLIDFDYSSTILLWH